MKYQSVNIIKLIIVNTGAINFPGTGHLHKQDTSNFYAINRIKWTIVDALNNDMKTELIMRH